MRRPLVMKHQINTLTLLSQRSRGVFDHGTLLRQNLNILRRIVLQDNNDFIKVWSKTSKCPVSYESGKIYFENYQCCYSSLHSEPQILYELPKRSKLEKIEDVLLCESTLHKSLNKPSDQKPCLLALTADNWLYRLSSETGQQLQKVYLSPIIKFRYLGWDVPQETFYIKSIQNKGTHLAGQMNPDPDTLMYLAVFHVFPLEFVAIMEIKKTVFGGTVTDVIISQGVLAVSHSTKSVKLYSFEHIIKKCMTQKLVLGARCPSDRKKTLGDAPTGIPINIHIKDCPPVLFEVLSFDNAMQIGGHPWHYIYTPPQKKHQGSHHICSLRDSTLALNGMQDMSCSSLESDWIYFHPDDSGRIIHCGPSTINVLKILSELEGGLQSKVVEDFSLNACRDNVVSNVCVTSSGRTVKRRFRQLADDPEQETFRMVEFEDELDLLAVVVTHTGETGEGKAHVRLHDNKTGLLLKIVTLEEPWDETYKHELFFDKDTLIHIQQMKNNKFCCHVYKLRANTQKIICT